MKQSMLNCVFFFFFEIWPKELGCIKKFEISLFTIIKQWCLD